MNFSLIGLHHFLMLALLLFVIGVFGIVISKNIVRLLICIEIMFTGVTLNFIAFSCYCDIEHFKGAAFALFIIVLASVHVAVGVAILLNIADFKNTVDTEQIGDLKG